MNQPETKAKVNKIMHELGAKLLNDCRCPNKTTLEFYQVGAEVCIVQYWQDGGCTHFIQGAGNTWDAMETQLHQIDAKSA